MVDYAYINLIHAEKNDPYFTVELHHGGWVTTETKKEYVGGRVNFFYYCNIDLMSLLEIEDMVESLGYSGKQDFYYIGGDSCWYKMETDGKLMNMLATVLTPLGRVVSIYVEHLYVPNVIKSQVGSCDVRTLNEPLTNEPNEPFDSLHNVPLEPFQQFEAFETVEVDIDSENGGSDSDSDKSTDLEYFCESDYDIEEDDALFDANTDYGVEWGGLRDKKRSN